MSLSLEVEDASPTSATLVIVHRQTERIAAKGLDALQQEAEENGGIQLMLADHFAKVYTVEMPLGGEA
jgi:hypothetical protein